MKIGLISIVCASMLVMACGSEDEEIVTDVVESPPVVLAPPTDSPTPTKPKPVAKPTTDSGTAEQDSGTDQVDSGTTETDGGVDEDSGTTTTEDPDACVSDDSFQSF